MGEQGATDNSSRQPLNPQQSSWLDWELAPDLSFGSVRSSVDTKSLSGSLDPSSFCTNSDCLTVRMKYEQLIEKIQQFLKIKSVSPNRETISVSSDKIHFSSKKDEEQTGDRFVENTEPESQMLQRLTSIHLEHFVRVPKNEENTDTVNDKFVVEGVDNVDAGGSHSVAVHDDIVDMIIRGNVENTEGHFSENETDDELVEKRQSQSSERKTSRRRKRISFSSERDRSYSACTDDGHFSEAEDDLNNTGNRSRHFSDSEVNQDEALVQTSQCDKSEGKFVVVNMGEEDSARFHSAFIVDEKPPGSEGITIHVDNLPKTGEETGDFFEENVPSMCLERRSIERKKTSLETGSEERFYCGDFLERISHDAATDNPSYEKEGGYIEETVRKDVNVVTEVVQKREVEATSAPPKKPFVRTHRRNYSEGDVVERSWSPHRDFGDARPVLETDLSAKSAKFDKGQRSYENAVFDILNSICPGTDPHRRRSARKQDTFQPAVENVTTTPEEFSDVPHETELREKYQELKKKFNDICKENNSFKAEQAKTKDQESQDSHLIMERENRLLREECLKYKLENCKLADTVKQMNSELLTLTQKHKSVDFQHDLQRKEKASAAIKKKFIKSHRRNYSEGDVTGGSLGHNKFDKGQRSYDNAVFDSLNTICPGTTPHRRPSSEKTEDNFQPTREGVTEKLSDVPHEKESGKKYKELLKKLDDLLKENISLKSEQVKMKHKELAYEAQLKGENEHKLLQEECTQYRLENEKLSNKVKQINNELLTLSKKYKSVDLHHYEEVIQKNVSLESEIASLKEDLKFVTEEIDVKVVELNNSRESLKSAESSNETVAKKIKELESNNIRLEKELNSESKGKDSYREEVKHIEIERDLLTEDNKRLREDVVKLKQEIENLKAVEQNYNKVMVEHNEFKNEISYLKAERNELLKIVEEERLKIQTEKDELEKALLAHDDINRQLENKLDEVRAENTALSELLKNERQAKHESKEREELLKKEKQELNAKIEKIESERKQFIREKQEIANEINLLKTEKDALNNNIKELKRKNEVANEELHAKTLALEDLTSMNDSLNEQVGSLTDKVIGLESKVSNLTKEIPESSSANKDLKGQSSIDDPTFDISEQGIELSKGVMNEKLKQHVESFDQATETKELEEEWLRYRDERPKPGSVKDEEEIGTDETGSSYTVSLDTVEIQDGPDLISLKEELEMLKTENVALKERIDSIDARSDSDTDLQILQDMREAIKTLKTEKDAIERQKSEVSDNLEKDQKRLHGEVEELLAENDALRKNMKIKEDSLRKENTEILKMYNDLRNEVEVLVISKHDLEVELHALKDLLEQEFAAAHEKTAEHDTSRELTLQDLEEMGDLKSSIEKLKSDLKEKDSYVRKLEEHLLGSDRGVPKFASTPKPMLSKGNSLHSKAMFRKTSLSSFPRKAFSQELPMNPLPVEREVEGAEGTSVETPKPNPLIVEELESSLSSEKRFVEGIGKPENKMTSSMSSTFRESANFSQSLDVSERIRSGLKADEDGHLALELKQFELVAEIAKLRRDLRETKAVYAQETSLLTEALENERLSKDLRSRSSSFGDHSVSSNISHDLLKLRKEVAVLREENRLLKIDNDRWLDRLKEQEGIVVDLKERLGRNTSGYGEIEEVFGRQLAMLQKQREELVNKLKDKEYQISTLSLDLGEKGIIEETLRKEKSILISKLEDRERLEKQLQEKKLMLEKQNIKQRELEDVIYRKDLNEIELMKQKRILEQELKDIESKFKDKEENLDYEKNRLLEELREKHNKSRSVFSESDDDFSSVCSESAAYSDRNVGRLEIMLEEVERQHAVAVNVLKEQLRTKYNRREKELRKEHAAGLAKVKRDSNRQVN